MVLPHLTKLLAFLSLVMTITALPTSTLDQTASLCRDKNIPCHAIDYTDLTAVEPISTSAEMAVQDMNTRALAKPPPNHCIIICGHAWCRPLCTDPSKPPSATDKIDAAAIADTTDLLAATNAQPGNLGIPLTPGMTTVMLGQKGNDDATEKCAWFCSSGAATCEESCWAAGDTQGAAVTDGGEVSEGDGVEGLVSCQVVDKKGVGRVIVCAVPEIGGDDAGAGGVGVGMRCVLFWREGEPQVVCRKA